MITAKPMAASSRIENVEHFPVTVTLNSDTDLSRHVVIELEDSDCLEFVLDWETHQLKKLILVLCNHFVISEEECSAPDATNETLFFDFPKIKNADLFLLTVYRNGMHFRMSEKQQIRFLKTGQIVFGLAKNDELTDLWITNMSAEEIEHATRELKIASEE